MGQVAVIGDGDDFPVLVQVPPVKDLESQAVPGKLGNDLAKLLLRWPR